MKSESPSQPIDPPEPRVGRATVPRWLLVALGAGVVWAIGHVSTRSGALDARVYVPYRTRQQVADLQPVARPDAAVVGGRRVFEAVCALCHGLDGAGQPGRAPPLAGSAWVGGAEDRLIRIALHGLSGPVLVGEQTWNQSMPGLGGAMSEEELAAVLTYARQAWGNRAPPITAARVGVVKAATAGRSRPWTVAELNANE